jgi:hypothetical protein
VEPPAAQQSPGGGKAGDPKGQYTTTANHNTGGKKATMTLSQRMVDWMLFATIGSNKVGGFGGR